MSYQAFWVANVIAAKGVDRSLVNTLAARSDVNLIEANDASNWLTADTADYTFDSVSMLEAAAPSSPRTVEPGVNQVKAPNVWSLGFNGTGIVVGNQDTGMRWTHNALKPHYRGWNGSTADHNFNWHDSIHSGGGICSPNHQEPCDDLAHGTHTTGTAVGDDGAGNQIGVAPGAKWIGCRNMDQGNGTPATYTECFQFFMAPTDLNNQNPNPALRPHVMNNSWTCPASEGCARNAGDDREQHAGGRHLRRGLGGERGAELQHCQRSAGDLCSVVFDRGADDWHELGRWLQQPRAGHGRRLEPDQAGHRRPG